ncbi:unnamed protein product [Lactuca saligna]|uniref:Dolichol phosphate-mannose biosynthesis regulatory protein n=2 Tax=Lactuca TaxID=4235 RepID=A0AA35YIZ6_LACSI|nr:unnamed protein product [Lactuca saligna]
MADLLDLHPYLLCLTFGNDAMTWLSHRFQKDRIYSKTTTKVEMELADRAVGFILASISVTVFTYYSFWVIVLPFVDSDHFVHSYFLPQEYAILLPVYAGVSLICFLSVFIGYVMLKSNSKKKKA